MSRKRAIHSFPPSLWIPLGGGYETIMEENFWFWVLEVGSFGVVRYNDGFLVPRPLKPRFDKYGYLYVNLCKDGARKTKKIHRLVAEHFIENKMSKPQVNHINEVKHDNRVENLEWCTAKENYNHGSAISLSSGGRSKQVEQMTLDGDHVAFWPSIASAGRGGFLHSKISCCCLGSRKSTGGYKWRFVTQSR